MRRAWSAVAGSRQLSAPQNAHIRRREKPGALTSVLAQVRTCAGAARAQRCMHTHGGGSRYTGGGFEAQRHTGDTRADGGSKGRAAAMHGRYGGRERGKAGAVVANAGQGWDGWPDAGCGGGAMPGRWAHCVSQCSLLLLLLLLLRMGAAAAAAGTPRVRGRRGVRGAADAGLAHTGITHGRGGGGGQVLAGRRAGDQAAGVLVGACLLSCAPPAGPQAPQAAAAR